MKNKKYINRIIMVITLIVIISLTIVACIKLLPFLLSLKDEANRIRFETYIDNLGILGAVVMLIIQVLQVFIAFIPGEIVELLAGFLYGTWGGLFICLIGNFIGSFLVYSVVKLFAKKHMINIQEKAKQYSFLNNKKKIAVYLFIIFLIPGLPKDIITYLVPFLPINFLYFIAITSIARIPSIISSTYSSDSFLNNNYTMAIIMIVIFSVLAIIGFIFKDKILDLLKKDNNKNKQSIDNTSK